MVFPIRNSEARRVLFVCLWLAVTGLIALQVQASEHAYVTLTSAAGNVPIAASAEVTCDPSGDLPFESARNAAYAPLRNEQPTSRSCRGYWIRFYVNAAEIPAGGWVLQLSHQWWRVDLNVNENGAIVAERTGTAIAPQARALTSGDMALPLPLAAGTDEVIYLHLVGDTTYFGDAKSIGGAVSPMQTWTREQHSLLFGQGIYAGIILGLALYSLILFLNIRDRAYLYYVLYVCSFGSFWIARTGFFYQYLWPNNAWWDHHFQPFLAALGIVFSILFVRQFLSLRERAPKTDRLLLGVAALTVVLCFASFFGPPYPVAPILAFIGLAVTVLYAAIAVGAVSHKYRPARFFLVAFVALLAGNVLYMLMFLRFLPMTVFTYNAAQAGSAIECILLAFALADRVNVLKHEHDKKQIEYTHDLQELVQVRTAELSAAVDQLKTASITDPLTGLSNRRHVDAAIQPWIAELQRERIRNLSGIPRRYLAICLGDLDHFKLINDNLGHAAGDKVLRSAANMLRQNVRATAILSRWGGEEFLILDHVTEPYEDVLMAERLRKAILEDTPPVMVESGRPLTLSLGVVRYPFSEGYPELLDWDHCLALADHALYRAKFDGRNRWCGYRPNEGALRRAIQARGEDEVRLLLRAHTDEAVALGLIEIVDQVPTDVKVHQSP